MKKISILLTILLFIISMISTVYAATGSISVGANTDTVEKGKTFTVTVVGTADNNINGMEAKLSYDSAKLVIQDKDAGSGFSDLSGNNEIVVLSKNAENLSKTGTLYTITFKVLDTAEEGQTKISVKDPVLALINEQATQENATASNDEVTVTIKAVEVKEEPEGEQPKEDEPKEDEPKEDETKEDETEKGQKEETKDTTTKENNKNKLPQTGVESTTLIAIVAVGLISIASYVSYRKYKNI